MKFDKNGRFVASVSLAHPTGPFATTHTVVMSPTGELWVGDRNAKKLIVFDQESEAATGDSGGLSHLRLVRRCAGRPVDGQPGWTAWCSSSTGTAKYWDGSANGAATPDSNDIGEAHQLAVSKDLKTVYVADSINAHVLKIESN